MILMPDNEENRALERYADEHAGDPDTFTELREDPDAVQNAIRERLNRQATERFWRDFNKVMQALGPNLPTRKD